MSGNQFSLISVDASKLGKPLQKLLEVCASGVGAIAGSWIIKKDSRAEAYAIKQIAAAKYDAKLIEQGTHALDADGNIVPINLQPVTSEVAEINARISFQERKRQNNLQHITQRAADLMPDQVSSDPVNEDWIARYFSSIQDISTEKMQEYWAKVLVGEICKPDTFSLKTIDILKNIGRSEIEVFEKVSPFILDGRLMIDAIGSGFQQDDLMLQFGVNYNDILALEEMGLVFSNQLVHDRKSYSEQEYINYVGLGHDMMMRIKGVDPKSKLSFHYFAFTKSGCELFKLIQSDSSQDYLAAVCAKLESLGYSVDFAYAPIYEHGHKANYYKSFLEALDCRSVIN